MTYAMVIAPPPVLVESPIPTMPFVHGYRQRFSAPKPVVARVRHPGLSAFGAVNLSEWWITACNWNKYVGALEKSFSGVCAHKGAPASPRFTDKTAEQWVNERCAAGDLVYVTAPYDDHGQNRIDLWAGKEPLPQGLTAGPPQTAAPFARHVCAGAPGPVVEQPPMPKPSTAETALAAACLMAVTGKNDVPLSPPVPDPETGKMVAKVVFDAQKNDCAFVFTEPSATEGKLPIVGAIALIAVIGGVYFIWRSR